MKTRVIKLTPKFFMDALQGKTSSSASNLPSEIELLDLKHDLFSNQILAVIRSDSFEETPENQPPSEFKLTFAPRQRDQCQSAKRPESVAIPKMGLEPIKESEIPRTQVPNGIEDEFSPEQRRLLSFRSEGDQTIVKPIQFLNAEWEDINETVKSIGGKWVKGDIISYWAIPSQLS